MVSHASIAKFEENCDLCTGNSLKHFKGPVKTNLPTFESEVGGDDQT